MPLPSPNKGETVQDFVSRFMEGNYDGDKPKEQRLAIAYSLFRESRKGKSLHVGEMVEKGVDKTSGRRTLLSIISTDDPDHDGDVILPRGINREKYTKKVLWGHDLSGKTLPFGRSMWEKPDSSGHKFLQKTEAPPLERMESEQAKFIGDLWTLYEGGLLNEWSITFGDHTCRGLTSKDLSENPHWKGASQVIPSCDLIEVSAVKVGNNWNTDTIERAAKDLKINELTFKALGLEFPVLKTQVAIGTVVAGQEEAKTAIQKDLPTTVPMVTKVMEEGKAWKDSAGHKVSVKLVDGSMVRHHHDQNFFGGSHDLHSGFIPAGEIWLDDGLSKKERDFVLAHELHERGNMSLGMWYEEAHRLADNHEYELRHAKDEKPTEPEVEVTELFPKGMEAPDVEEELPVVELTTKARVEKAIKHHLYLAKGGV